MTREQRRATRLAVIAAERDRDRYGYVKRAARLLNLSAAQVKHLAGWWGLACQKK